MFCNGAPRTMLQNQKMTAQIDGEFVVFLIGMRINQFWKVHKMWFARILILVQCWRSMDQLMDYVYMPAFGMGKAGTLVPAKGGLQSAKGRLSGG
jgi:hypothetical protein